MVKPIRVRLDTRATMLATRATLRLRMAQATIIVRDEAKVLLNTGQPRKTTAAGNIVGLAPSKPGEPPRKITGQLQNSIRNEVRESLRTIVGLVGTDLKKARPLELGNRKGTLKARPFLRPALFNNLNRVRRILLTGK